MLMTESEIIRTKTALKKFITDWAMLLDIDIFDFCNRFASVLFPFKAMIKTGQSYFREYTKDDFYVYV